jgi:hypothetical protein
MTPESGEVAPLIDPDRPSPANRFKPPTRGEGMTGSLSPAPAGETRNEDVNDRHTHKPKAEPAPLTIFLS